MVSMDRSYRVPDMTIFVRDVRDPEQRKRPVSVRSWSTIKDVKDILKDLIDVPPSAQRIYFGPLLTANGELPNYRTLHDAGIYKSGETLLLDIKQSKGEATTYFSSVVSLHQSNDICVSSSMYDSTPKPLRALVQKARRAFALGLKPEFILDGSGGSYFIHDGRKSRIAVFKPADEEPYAENNPRSYLQQGAQNLSLREGIVPGEACIREVAAYLLDHKRFSSVPMTTLVEARHPTFNTNGSRLTVADGGACIGAHSINPNFDSKSVLMKKVGSFQEFVRCEGTMDDISPSMISTEEVHKIAILDIRIMNADRNAANLLVRRKSNNSLQLIPIDHGFCLRSVCDVSWMDWCWLDWPQLKQPISEEHQKYIRALDIEKDAELLRSNLGIGQEAIDYFRASTILLKAGVDAGLTLYDIAILCCRNDDLAEVPSMMEKLFSMASDLAMKAVENERWHHLAASLAIEEKLTPNRRSSIAYQASGFKIRKSSSSLGFHSFNSSPESAEASSGRDSPGLVQSSASDSSSDCDGRVDPEECGEWAENVIASATAGNQVAVQQARSIRSASIASDEGSGSSSRKGFWTVAPGSSIGFDDEDEDGSVTWTPQSSPRSSVITPEDVPEHLALPPTTSPKSPKVTFASKLPTGPFIPPATVAVTSSTKDSGFLRSLKSEGGMTRSKSYSSMPHDTSTKRVAVERAPQPYSGNYENYRKYFHKFIDLVIVRETATASLNRRAESL